MPPAAARPPIPVADTPWTRQGLGRLPASLANSEWRITEVDGEDVSRADNYTLRFDENGLSGRAGCNSLSAGVGAEGDRLQVTPIAMTRMACPGARMRHEQFVAGLLASRPRIAFPGARTLVITGESGSIRLQRVN
jgi:heat shock protein HslJ